MWYFHYKDHTVATPSFLNSDIRYTGMHFYWDAPDLIVRRLNSFLRKNYLFIKSMKAIHSMFFKFVLMIILSNKIFKKWS